ncbi:MAG: hypothetical protein V7L00_21860 [Nostoc sp.]|uniref:hypothetical protein n=1 Tax=Nostoc sp. TaxID=1180 RepID=UPI002FF492A9
MSSGQRVQQGTPIASLSLDQTQANVASSIAAANSAQAALATAQAQHKPKPNAPKQLQMFRCNGHNSIVPNS